MKLRYTGKIATNFPQRGVSVDPEGVFTVSDEEADAYLARTDVEKVAEAPPRQKAAPKTPAPQAPDDTVTA